MERGAYQYLRNGCSFEMTPCFRIPYKYGVLANIITCLQLPLLRVTNSACHFDNVRLDIKFLMLMWLKHFCKYPKKGEEGEAGGEGKFS